MEELMIVANVAIVFGVIYKLFELFVRRKERMMLIEKMGDKLTPEVFKNGIFLSSVFVFVRRAAFGLPVAGVGFRFVGWICHRLLDRSGKAWL